MTIDYKGEVLQYLSNIVEAARQFDTSSSDSKETAASHISHNSIDGESTDESKFKNNLVVASTIQQPIQSLDKSSNQRHYQTVDRKKDRDNDNTAILSSRKSNTAGESPKHRTDDVV